ncbi:MAG TPA: helix-turn-helix domain-containing protein [Methanocella sp.]
MDRSRAFEAALVITLILLAALLYFAVVSTPRAASSWESEFSGNVDYMFVGSDDTLYTFSGSLVSAMSKDGNVLWQYAVPSEWRVLNDWDMPIYSSGNGGAGKPFCAYPIVAESNGSLYLFAISRLNWTDVDIARNNVSEKTIGTDYHYLSPDIPFISKSARIMKISPEGIVAWNYSFLTNLSTWYIGGLVSPDVYTMEKPIALSVAGDRIYLFHDYTEDVLDTGGRLLFSIPNVSAPVAVDEAGRIYSVRAVQPSQEQFNLSMTRNGMEIGGVEIGWDSMKMSQDLTFMLAGSIVDAYAADGNLLWSCDTGANATRPFLERDVWPYYNTLPLLSNHQLYVPVEDGMIAVSQDGKVNWTTRIGGNVYTYFSVMPVDSHGNIYMMKLDSQWQSSVMKISSDGQAAGYSWPCYAWPYYEHQLSYNPGMVISGGKDGIAYAFTSRGNGMFGLSQSEFENMLSSRRFYADTIRAYDFANGGELWNFTIPMADRHVITLNAGNVKDAIMSPLPFVDESAADITPHSIFPTGRIEMYPGKDVLYLSYYYTVFESPLVVNKSRCIYARGLYALDNNGKLLWEKQVSGNIDQVAVGNKTVYYSLDNGHIGGRSLDIAAGAAITAFAYVFLRFFMLGTIARARNRLEGNENRNEVLRYVIDNPGVTAADIAKGMKMNMGTIRYHLFVLTANHRIVTHKDNGKFLRYFRNSGAYTEAEKDLLSLLRRRPLQKVLRALLERPERSCTDLARELDISVAAASRHIGELADRGVVEKLPVERGFVYVIKGEHRERIRELLVHG